MTQGEATAHGSGWRWPQPAAPEGLPVPAALLFSTRRATRERAGRQLWEPPSEAPSALRRR